MRKNTFQHKRMINFSAWMGGKHLSMNDKRTKRQFPCMTTHLFPLLQGEFRTKATSVWDAIFNVEVLEEHYRDSFFLSVSASSHCAIFTTGWNSLWFGIHRCFFTNTVTYCCSQISSTALHFRIYKAQRPPSVSLGGIWMLLQTGIFFQRRHAAFDLARSANGPYGVHCRWCYGHRRWQRIELLWLDPLVRQSYFYNDKPSSTAIIHVLYR